MSARLIKFNGKKADSLLKQIKGKKVCDVVRRRTLRTFADPRSEKKFPFLQWSGTTEDEFFVATFYAGLLTLDVNEREMLLGRQETVIIVALSAQLETLNVIAKNDTDFTEKADQNAFYLQNHYKDDLENLRFRDAMKIFDWKFTSRKVKEEYHDFE
jgi:hypothetical protein